MTTATLGDHLAAQGIETNELYSRGARVRKREVAAEAKDATTATEFLAVKVVPPPESAPRPRAALCRITHCAGHVIEFSEWPEASWLAVLLGGVSGTTP